MPTAAVPFRCRDYWWPSSAVSVQAGPDSPRLTPCSRENRSRQWSVPPLSSGLVEQARLRALRQPGLGPSATRAATQSTTWAVATRAGWRRGPRSDCGGCSCLMCAQPRRVRRHWSSCWEGPGLPCEGSSLANQAAARIMARSQPNQRISVLDRPLRPRDSQLRGQRCSREGAICRPSPAQTSGASR